MIYDYYRDICLSYEGDFILDNGDLAIVGGQEWLKREINKILRTDNPDWATNPRAGADVSAYIGRSNNRQTACELKDSIEQALVKNGLTDVGAYDVKVVPVSRSKVSVLIYLLASGDRYLVGDMIYEFSGAGMTSNMQDTIAQPTSDALYPSTHKKNDNQYLGRLRLGV